MQNPAQLTQSIPLNSSPNGGLTMNDTIRSNSEARSNERDASSRPFSAVLAEKKETQSSSSQGRESHQSKDTNQSKNDVKASNKGVEEQAKTAAAKSSRTETEVEQQIESDKLPNKQNASDSNSNSQTQSEEPETAQKSHGVTIVTEMSADDDAKFATTITSDEDGSKADKQEQALDDAPTSELANKSFDEMPLADEQHQVDRTAKRDNEISSQINTNTAETGKQQGSENQSVDIEESKSSLAAKVASVGELEKKLNALTNGEQANWLTNVMKLSATKQVATPATAELTEDEAKTPLTQSESLQSRLSKLEAEFAVNNKQPEIDAEQGFDETASVTISQSVQVADIELTRPVAEQWQVNTKDTLDTEEQALNAQSTQVFSSAAIHSGLTQELKLSPVNEAVTANVSTSESKVTSATAAVIANLLKQEAGAGQVSQFTGAGTGQTDSGASDELMTETGNLTTQSLTESARNSLFANGIGSSLEVSSTSPNENTQSAVKVDVAGVSVERATLQPKVEVQAQIKQDFMIKENILFNKQELAANVQQQIGIMMARNMKSIDIRLDPPELGSMQIRMQVNGEQAAVSFVVNTQQAKDALENALPRLKEMLEQQGMDLTDADVQKDNQSAGGSDENGQQQQGNGNVDGAENAEQDDVAMTVNVDSPYRVDYYA